MGHGKEFSHDGTPRVYGGGRVFQPRRRDGTLKSSRWSIAYYVNGEEKREPTGKTTELEALNVLRRRLGEIDSDTWVEPAYRRMIVDEVLDLYVENLEERLKKSVATSRSHLKPVRVAFGERRALTLKPKDFKKYRKDRKAAGTSEQTIDRELTLLRASYSFGVRKGWWSRSNVPYVAIHHADVVRQGFVEHEQFEAVAAHLPDVLADVARFAFLSAWRRGEIVPLRWTQVDRRAREVRLETSKSGHPRTLPLEGALWDLIERRWQARQHETASGTALSPLVFHDGGRPVGDFRKAWASACKAAGVARLRFHDLRRSGIRNLIRGGVPQSVAMSISGHRTVATILRYDIASDEDKREALRAVAAHTARRPASNVVPLQKAQDVKPRSVTPTEKMKESRQ